MSGQPFYHEPVLLQEALDGLSVRPEGVYVDATFGGGGHSKAILAQMGAKGRLIVFDQDEDAWKNKPEDDRVILVKENFRHLKRFLRLHQVSGVDGLLADLGVSSYQFDTPERGFSIRFDGPLDMRMDRRGEVTAATVLASYSESQLHTLFEQYGEVRNSRELARHIVERRKMVKLATVESLRAVLEPIMKGNPNRYLAQVFQALRIEVNDELGALKDLLEQAAQSLRPGGRMCIITFHSLEDRIVKHFMKGTHDNDNILMPANATRVALKMLTAKPVEATEAEQKRNPRSRSARLRVAERIK